MARENKKVRNIRINPIIDRKIERVAEHAGTTYIAALEWLTDAGYRYYIEQSPSILDGVFGKKPEMKNIKPLKK